jgi:Rrf2 family nitric oxide-sensitive transcriptional repressor
MNKINRKVEYALMSLKYMTLKIPSHLTSAKEVSETFHTPFDATARVMQVMAQHGLLRSEQGVSGGYRITGDLSKTSLLNLFEMIEGPTALVKCAQEESRCEIKGQCNIISPLHNLNLKYQEFFEKVTLKELLVNHES